MLVSQRTQRSTLWEATTSEIFRERFVVNFADVSTEERLGLGCCEVVVYTRCTSET